MGTRSTIALEFADGTVEQVYCHWDGYLSHNGKILQDRYMDPFTVKELLALGGFSSLQETVKETEGTAYHHWRGEELCINKFRDFNDYAANGQDEEYDYILRCVDGKAVWFVRCYATEGRFVSFETAREMEALETEDEDY
jgi:hypothetical protein